jgi:hypothetical protein
MATRPHITTLRAFENNKYSYTKIDMRRNQSKLSKRERNRKIQISNLQDTRDEFKFAASSWDVDSVPIGTIITDATQISTGTTYTTRVGNKIRVVRCEYNMLFTVADTTNVVRMIIFQWLGNSVMTGVPDWTDILDYGTSGVPTTDRDLVSLPVRSRNQDLYDILDDKIMLMSAYRPQVMARGVVHPNLKNVFFDASSNLGKNHIYVLLASDSTAVTHPTVSGEFRVIYEDA